VLAKWKRQGAKVREVMAGMGYELTIKQKYVSFRLNKCNTIKVDAKREICINNVMGL